MWPWPVIKYGLPGSHFDDRPQQSEKGARPPKEGPAGVACVQVVSRVVSRVETRVETRLKPRLEPQYEAACAPSAGAPRMQKGRGR